MVVRANTLSVVSGVATFRLANLSENHSVVYMYMGFVSSENPYKKMYINDAHSTEAHLSIHARRVFQLTVSRSSFILNVSHVTSSHGKERVIHLTLLKNGVSEISK